MNNIDITDDLGIPVRLDHLPARIVSLVPSLTETLFTLGAGERLVGVTDYCIHPAEAVRDIPHVGGTKDPSIARILELTPDLVIANAEENEKNDVEQLRNHTTVFVTHPSTVAGAIKTVQDLGAMTGTVDKAGRFAEACRHTLDSLAGQTPRTTHRTACLIWRNPWMAAGPATYMSDLIRTAGFENIFIKREPRYPKTTIDALVSANPDVILLPNEPYPFGEAEKDEIFDRFASAAGTPSILLVEGTYFAWFGSRTLDALEYLKKLKETL